MAGALYQDWENYNPNNPTALRPPSYWDAVKENLPHALRGFQRMPTNVMGFPVDMVNLAVGAEKPFLGSEYLAEKLNVPERTGHPTELGTEIASEFLLPTGQGLGRSALKAEEFLGRTLKEKLPEFVGKHVPEPFRTPITGLNIAKVYNKEGKLIDKVDDVVYHGTNKSFDKFSDEFKAIAGSSTDETLPKAHWFTDDPVTAGYYSEKAAGSTYLGVDKSFIPENRMGMKVFRDGGTGGENIRPSILNAKLLDLDMKGGSFQGRGYNKVNSKIREAKKDGYDGLRIRNYSDPANFSGITKEHRPSTHYAIFEGSKIDSALSPNLTKQAPKVDLSMRRQTNDFFDAMENDDLIFVGGVPSGNSRAGEIRRRYVVFDAKDKSKQLGEFEVFTDDKTNNFLGLVELKVKDKRKGTGKKIIDSLMQSDFVNDDFRIHSALKASIPFWKKMGTKFPEEDLRKFEKMKGHVTDKAIPLGIISKQAPKIENLNFNELLTAWTVDQTKVPRKLLSDKLSTPENKNRTIKALNNLGYKDTVPVYRTVRYKGELKDEDLISASLTPEANINFTKFSTEGKTINPLSDNPVPQDFAILRYDVPINDVKGYLPEFAGDIKRTVNKKIKDLGIGQEKISGLKTVTNPSAHAKQLLSTQDEIIADVSKIKPKVLQHYGGNKNLNPLSSELSIPSEIAKGKITKPSDLPSNYSVLPFPKGGINAPKEAWDAWAKNEEIAKKEMIKYYKEFYNIK